MSESLIGKGKKTFTCIVCPKGCEITVSKMDNDELNIEGYDCKRGMEYATTEYTEPKRILATTVRIRNAQFPLIPVRTDVAAPKEKLPEILDFLAKIEVDAPITCGDVLVPNVLGLDVNVIATRTLKVDICERVACST
jgi:CxxC motif-containing protein